MRARVDYRFSGGEVRRDSSLAKRREAMRQRSISPISATMVVRNGCPACHKCRVALPSVSEPHLFNSSVRAKDDHAMEIADTVLAGMLDGRNCLSAAD